jgi:hypothetical protein
MKFSILSVVVFAVFASIVPSRAYAISDSEITAAQINLLKERIARLERASTPPEDPAAAGRLVAQRYADAIISVKGTALMRVTIGERTMPPREQKIDVNGTVITATGLVVTSWNGLDVRATFEALRSQINTNQPVDLGKTDFKLLRIRLNDGTEVPVKIASKDPERDLVFLAPVDDSVANRHPFTFVDLNGAREGAAVLGNYYQVSRADELIQRALLVRACTVNAILERPRRLLLVSTNSFADTLGCPIFDSHGKVVGICLHYVDAGLPKGTVVLPAADVAAGAADAFSQQ